MRDLGLRWSGASCSCCARDHAWPQCGFVLCPQPPCHRAICVMMRWTWCPGLSDARGYCGGGRLRGRCRWGRDAATGGGVARARAIQHYNYTELLPCATSYEYMYLHYETCTVRVVQLYQVFCRYIYISGGLESRVFCIEIEISCRCFGIIFHVSVSFSTLLEVSRECMWVKIICNLVHGTVVFPLCVPIWGCYIVFFQKRKPKFMPTY